MARRPSSLRYLPPEIPLAIAAAALALTLGFQGWELLATRSALVTAGLIARHDARPGKSVRAQLEKLADGTARLAADGDDNAKAVMAEMQKLGVTLHRKQ